MQSCKETMAKKATKEKELINIELPAIPEHLLVRHPPRWVCVHFKLVEFSALDDCVRLPQTATLHMVECKIIAHHGGSIEKLTLWRDAIHPYNMLRDLSQTLAQVWKLDDALPATMAANPASPASAPSPSKKGEAEDHHVVVWYDYKAHDSDCPLLLRSPRYPQSMMKRDEKDDKKKP